MNSADTWKSASLIRAGRILMFAQLSERFKKEVAEEADAFFVLLFCQECVLQIAELIVGMGAN